MCKLAAYAITASALAGLQFVWLPASADAPTYRYTVFLGNMKVVNGVSHGKDTDYISLQVTGPNGQKFSGGAGPVDVGKGDTYIWKFAATPVAIPADASSTLLVSWAASNSGHRKRDDVIKGLMSAAGSIGMNSDDPYVAIPGALMSVGAMLISKNCDAPLFGGKFQIDGTALAAGLNGHDGWQSEGPNMWHKVFEYQNIRSACDTGHYTLDVHIKRL